MRRIEVADGEPTPRDGLLPDRAPDEIVGMGAALTTPTGASLATFSPRSRRSGGASGFEVIIAMDGVREAIYAHEPLETCEVPELTAFAATSISPP